MNDFALRRLGWGLLVLILLLSVSACAGKPEDMQTVPVHSEMQDNAGYNDSLIGDAYADEIFAFYRAGILTGSDRLGTFRPESSLKRSEAAAILVRLYDASQRQYITLK